MFKYLDMNKKLRKFSEKLLNFCCVWLNSHIYVLLTLFFYLFTYFSPYQAVFKVIEMPRVRGIENMKWWLKCKQYITKIFGLRYYSHTSLTLINWTSTKLTALVWRENYRICLWMHGGRAMVSRRRGERSDAQFDIEHYVLHTVGIWYEVG